METNKSVDSYILKSSNWIKELELLRELMLSLHLEEQIKWGTPVYSINGKNVVGLAAFKNYAGIWFFQGALLKDPRNKLYNAKETTAIAMRQWRFESFDEIADNAETIIEYVAEAVSNMEKGIVIPPKVKKPLEIPKELEIEFRNNPQLKIQFDRLNLTRKREFCTHILSAKREATKQDRLAKIIPMIIDGKGIHDKYRK